MTGSDARAFAATRPLRNGQSVIVLTGELDIASAGELRHALQEAEESGSDEINVDIAALSFIDSSGLAVLVAAQQNLGKQGRRLFLTGATAPAKRVFEIAGLLEFLRVDMPTPEGSSERAVLPPS